MGLINEKEEPSLILELLKENQSLIENNGSNEYSFELIHKIINYYEELQSIIKKNEKKSFIETNDNYNYNFPIKNKKNYLNEINHQLKRIQKWIFMAKTKDNLQRSIRGKSFVSKNEAFHNAFLKNLNICNSNESKEIIIQSPNKKVYKKLTNKYANFENNNINITDYTDFKIEKGIKNFFIKNNNKFLERVYKGPPECFRLTSWIVLNNIPLDRNKEIYEFYSKKELNLEIKNSIIKDIQRTFPTENTEILRPKEKKLYSVLKAFSNLDIELGYCQGMNLIVAFLLNVSNFNESETFFLLISIFSSTFKERGINYNYNFSMRGMFNNGFPLLLFMNYIFDKEFRKLLPDLKKKFEDFSITYDVWIGKWFQTLFTIVLPIEWCKRLFDCVFVNGIFFQINFGLAIIIFLEKILMKFEDEIEILNYFQDLIDNPLNVNKKILVDFSIEDLIKKSEKIRINIKDYYNKYIEEFPSFEDDIERNNIEYNIIGIEEINKNIFNLINFDRKETILFESEDEESLKSNDKEEEKKEETKPNLYNYTLLEENIPNKFLSPIKKKKSTSVIKINGNYDDDVDENVIVNDIDESSIFKEFPDSDKKSFKSYNIEKYTLNEKEILNLENSHRKSSNYENNFFIKVKNLYPNSKNDI
jgi:hypothetical protein